MSYDQRPGPEVKGMIVVDDWVDESVLGAWHFVTSEEVLAAVRRGVESGTIKGEEVEWCEEHEQAARTCPFYKYETLERLHTPCHIVSKLLIPVSDGGSET